MAELPVTLSEQSVDERGAYARWGDGLRRLPWPPLLILGTLLVMALFAPLLAGHSPFDQSLANRLQPPAWVDGGSADHLLGTDKLGRDLFARIIHGTRVTLSVAVASLLAGATAGAIVGIAAGYLGGRVDSLLMRVVDAAMAFPMILIALLLAVTMGAGYATVVLAIALVLWARFARIIRGEVLSVRQRDFIAFARISGCSHLRIMLLHVLPNVMNTLLVLTTLNLGYTIIVEASLSFLGAGIPPPIPSWGQMVAEGREHISSAWWLSVAPGLAIALTVLAFNSLGDWLRDTLDPKLRQI